MISCIIIQIKNICVLYINQIIIQLQNVSIVFLQISYVCISTVMF